MIPSPLRIILCYKYNSTAPEPAFCYCFNYLTKGKQVYVEGRLQTRSYEDKDGRKVYTTEVVAEDVILLGGRGGEAGSPEEGSQVVSTPRSASRGQGAASAPAPSPDLGVTDDDVPF